ncbi:ABC transporter permease, partial [Synechococcus sp. R55.2]|uniref:ABC transporter permease n=1 Tax=Synechococcus sp. R55.2 TaxID=2964496 RepID=UPI0039C35115
ALFGLSLFYQQGHRLGGWSWPEALIVLGVFTILQGVSASLFNVNLNRIVQQVQEGTLDFVLLKPISSQFWLSARVFSPWGLTDVGFGLLLILHAGIQLGLPGWAYAVGLLPLLLGLIILYSLWFMLGATSIWFVKIYNVTEVLRGLVEAGRFPMVAYPVAYRVFFTFIVPVAFLTTIPAETLLGRVQWPWLLGSGLLAAGLLWGSHLFWRFALRFYTSASS